MTATTQRVISQPEIDGFQVDQFDPFTATDDQFAVYWAWSEQHPDYQRDPQDPELCQLCGVAMGEEAGSNHSVCMAREDFFADIGGEG